jgi:hypothetical protein
MQRGYPGLLLLQGKKENGMVGRPTDSIFSLLADLWRELSWLMRLLGLLGLLSGAAVGVWMWSGFSPESLRGHLLRWLLLTVLGTTVAGAAMGLALGALIEWLGGSSKR